ncbi:MAG TPA: class I SAM-dependent methyltransferase [Candidatus Acidoferrales bacterium]|nr:class I SAM-dependent methyltransferase [Candidatus Acidoferrales bacterium]
MRAVHQISDSEPKILLDPIAPRLVNTSALDANWLAPMLGHPFARQWRAGFLIRSRYAEDCLAEAVTRGLVQYLVLGAGLDTFAYRQPAWAHKIDIFEVDHPTTQAFKRGQLAKAGIEWPANLTFVPIDFESASLKQTLRAAAFAFDKPTFCSWLGVTQYLTAAAIEATLALTLSLPRTSEIVLSFITPQAALSGLEADAVATAAAKSAEVGEPWLSRFDPADLASQLRRMGFSQVVHFTPEQAHECYLKNRQDDLAGRRGEQLMRAIV